MTGVPRIEELDRIFAGHFGAKRLIPSFSERGDGSSARNSSIYESDEAKTPSSSGSVASRYSYKGSAAATIERERAVKLQQLYSTLSELYIDQQQQQKQQEHKIHKQYRQQQNQQSLQLPDRSSVESELCSPRSGFSQLSFGSPLTFSSEEPDAADEGVNLVDIVSPRSPTGFASVRRGSDEEISYLKGAADTSTPPSFLFGTAPAEVRTRPRRRSSFHGFNGLTTPGVEQAAADVDVRHPRGPRLSIDQGRAAERSQSVPPQKVLKPLQEIFFTTKTVPDVERSDDEARHLLAQKFPTLCEPPVRMFGENGEPLPPTKKEETTPEERKARKEALELRFLGKTKHSLIKSMVILENRTANWRRIGSTRRPQAACPPLPSVPDPWALEMYHQDLDKLEIEGKAKRAFELSDSRVVGLCSHCDGQGQGPCTICKGAEADDCWWCAGTGQKKNLRACERCQGAGKLKCQACYGTLRGPCEPCKGEGYGLYSLLVHIKVRRVDFPPMPLSSLLDESLHHNAEAVQEAAVQHTRGLINKLMAAASVVKNKSAFRPLTASCAFETSTASLVEVDVPLQAKMTVAGKGSISKLNRQKSASGNAPSASVSPSTTSNSLRPTGLHRKIQTTTRYFVLPSDPDLRPAEMTRADFNEAMRKDVFAAPISKSGRRGSVSHTRLLPAPNGAMAPLSASFRPQASPMAQMGLTPIASRSSSPVRNMSSHDDNSHYEANDGDRLSNLAPALPTSSPPIRPSRSHLRGHQRTGSTPMPLSSQMLQQQYLRYLAENPLPPLPSSTSTPSLRAARSQNFGTKF